MALEYLLEEMASFTDDELAEALYGLPPGIVETVLGALNAATGTEAATPTDPLRQAQLLDPGIRNRPHLDYLASRLAKAVKDVEEGRSRKLLVKMPPRMGKSHLTSIYLPLWLLHRHPDWKVGLVSSSQTLAVGWGRQVRRIIEGGGGMLGGLELAKDAGAVADWETTKGGGVRSRSSGQALVGHGFKVMLVDDPVKDFASAHSNHQRDSLWEWWQADVLTRLEPPSLVIVVMTRWHEDDLMGRILSADYDGDPADWEEISFPAIAEEHDVLGREPGEPLYSPILTEAREEALARWEDIRKSQGSYVWNALYQQKPSSPTGSIFNVDWWRFWTPHKHKATKDGRIAYFNPADHTRTGNWLDSWDMAFKGTDSSDFVAGQRWVKVGPDRYLIAQKRGRWDFTETLMEVDLWTDPESDHETSPYGPAVHVRLIEDKANGSAVMSVLKAKVPGLIPVSVTAKDGGKEARARAESPTIEAGNVRLPLPSDPGNEWVSEYLSEFREFPTGANDDQVDTTTQALARYRMHEGTGHVGQPATTRRSQSTASSLIAAAKAQRNTPRGTPRGHALGLARPRSY